MAGIDTYTYLPILNLVWLSYRLFDINFLYHRKLSLVPLICNLISNRSGQPYIFFRVWNIKKYKVASSLFFQVRDHIVSAKCLLKLQSKREETKLPLLFLDNEKGLATQLFFSTPDTIFVHSIISKSQTNPFFQKLNSGCRVLKLNYCKKVFYFTLNIIPWEFLLKKVGFRKN